MGISRLVVVDNLRDARSYIKTLTRDKLAYDKKDIIIALNPSVYLYLYKKGLAVNNTLPYFNTVSHEKILQKSDELMKWIRGNIRLVDFGLGLEDAVSNSFTFFSRLMIHHFLFVNEVILNALEIHDPDQLMASLGQRKSRDLYITPEENYAGTIVEKIAREKKIAFRRIPGETEGPPVTKMVKAQIKCLLKILDFFIWQKRLSLSEKKNSRRFILMTADDSYIEYLADLLEDSGGRVAFLRGSQAMPFPLPGVVIKLFWRKYLSKIERQKERFTQLCSDIKGHEELFSYREMSFAGILSNRIAHSMIYYSMSDILWSITLTDFLAKTRPDFIISNGGRIDDTAIALAAKKRGIPVFLISHGSLTRPKNDFERIEWGEQGRTLLRAPFSHIALQTPLAEGYLDSFPPIGRPVKTGPLGWGLPINNEISGRLFSKYFKERFRREKTKVIVHAGTPKGSKTLRPYVYETSDEYIKAIKDLAAVVESLPDAVLVVRFRPTLELNEEIIKGLISFSDKVVFISEGGFIDTLGMADLLVSFSSTTIEEALQNNIPVLLYGGEGRYQHVSACRIESNKPLERSAVYHAGGPRALEYGITRIFEMGIKGDKDRELFKQYIYTDREKESITDLLKYSLPADLAEVSL